MSDATRESAVERWQPVLAPGQGGPCHRRLERHRQDDREGVRRGGGESLHRLSQGRRSAAVRPFTKLLRSSRAASHLPARALSTIESSAREAAAGSLSASRNWANRLAELSTRSVRLAVMAVQSESATARASLLSPSCGGACSRTASARSRSQILVTVRECSGSLNSPFCVVRQSARLRKRGEPLLYPVPPSFIVQHSAFSIHRSDFTHHLLLLTASPTSRVERPTNKNGSIASETNRTEPSPNMMFAPPTCSEYI